MLEIGSTVIGDDEPAYIIAEAGVNVRGDLELAKAFITAAADAGADAIKFQTHIADAEMVESEMDGLGMGDLFDRMGEYTFSEAEHRELQSFCRENNITFLSTPFSVEAVALLNEIDVPAYKIGSGELTNYHLLEQAGATGRPLLVSTGMADWETVERACNFLGDHTDSLALFYCVSEYPTDPTDFELGVIDRMKAAFDVPVGLSDHSTGVEAAMVAIARGADVVEKHFTIDRRLPGGDQEVSIEPEELERLVEFADICHQTQGSQKGITADEQSIKDWAQHSVVTATDIEADEIFTTDNLTTRRPGTGIPADRYFEVTGETAAESVPANTVLTEDHLD